MEPLFVLVMETPVAGDGPGWEVRSSRQVDNRRRCGRLHTVPFTFLSLPISTVSLSLIAIMLMERQENSLAVLSKQLDILLLKFCLSCMLKVRVSMPARGSHSLGAPRSEPHGRGRIQVHPCCPSGPTQWAQQNQALYSQMLESRLNPPWGEG